MSKRPARFQFESLESRQMMAGDISAYVQNGNLYLVEAAGHAGRDQAAWVSHLSNGKVRVEGTTNADGIKSRINGGLAQEFTVASSVFVNFGGGNDQVVFTESSTRSFWDINVDMSAPPLTNAPAAKSSKAPGGVGTAINPPDNDFVTLWGANARHSLNVRTGAGADYVQVLGGEFGHGGSHGTFTVNTGAGADQVEVGGINGFWLDSVDVQTYASAAETDADSVALSNMQLFGNVGVRLGGGGDGFSLTDIESYGRIDIDAGAGSDNAALERVYAGDQLMARLGEGDDNLRLNQVTATKLRLLGDGGLDRLTKTGAVNYTTLEQTSWEYINGIPQWPTNSASAKAAGVKAANAG